jgi:hypothetical protein
MRFKRRFFKRRLTVMGDKLSTYGNSVAGREPTFRAIKGKDDARPFKQFDTSYAASREHL